MKLHDSRFYYFTLFIRLNFDAAAHTSHSQRIASMLTICSGLKENIFSLPSVWHWQKAMLFYVLYVIHSLYLYLFVLYMLLT